MESFSWKAWLAWLEGTWESVQSQLSNASPDATDLARFVTGSGQFTSPTDFLMPLVGIAAGLAGLILAGVAVASLGTLLASLLGLGFLLTEVFGLTIEVDGSRMPF